MNGFAMFKCRLCKHSVTTMDFNGENCRCRTQAARAMNEHATVAHRCPLPISPSDGHLVLMPSYRISGSRGSAGRFLFPPPLLVRLPRPLSQTEVTGKRLRSHWAVTAACMLGVMYTINNDASGVILVCHDCPHTEHVNEFDDRLGSRRTQAATAMLKHVRNEHAKAPIGNPKPQIMEQCY